MSFGGHSCHELVRYELWFVRNCVERAISIEATLAKMLQFHTQNSINS